MFHGSVELRAARERSKVDAMYLFRSLILSMIDPNNGLDFTGLFDHVLPSFEEICVDISSRLQTSFDTYSFLPLTTMA